MWAVRSHDQISKPDIGTENGYRGGDQFPIHVVNNGARKGKRISQCPRNDLADRSFRSIQSTLSQKPKSICCPIYATTGWFGRGRWATVRVKRLRFFHATDNIQATPRRFSPTRLATTLTSSLPPLPTASGGAGSESKGEGFIVLETNYRIYAYTGPLMPPRESHELGSQLYCHSPDNPLQTAVLNLFVTLKSRFPNLVVGSITRDSVKRALMNGITADQVGYFQYPVPTP